MFWTWQNKSKGTVHYVTKVGKPERNSDPVRFNTLELLCGIKATKFLSIKSSGEQKIICGACKAVYKRQLKQRK